MTQHNDSHQMNRRRFLIASTQLALGLCLISPGELIAKSAKSKTITLVANKKKHANPITLIHTHTQEHFQLRYIGKTPPQTVKRDLYSFLRDYRTGDVHPIDFRLMDILQKIQRETGSKGVYEVISAYRSPQSNALLRKKSFGVAKNSLHLKGQAIDIRLKDLSTKDLRDVAISLKAGGVGYYAKSDFVHIDTGPVRLW